MTRRSGQAEPDRADEPHEGRPAPPDPARPGRPPPDLSLRAPRPRAVRLRRSAVRAVVLSGTVLLSGALAWAFVVQPGMRDAARARAAETRAQEAGGPVRPAETVHTQPATYDRLPPSRGLAASPVPEPSADAPAAQSQQDGGMRPRPADSPRSHREPTPAEMATRSGLFFEMGRGGAEPARSAQAPVERLEAQESAYNGHALTAPASPFELKAGTVIPAVLLTAVDTEHAGPVVATVSQNVFDTVTGRHLVLPQGARLIGRQQGDSAYGDRRAFLIWERLILPNGKSLLLTGAAGVDAQGAVGVRGQVDRRLLPLVIGTVFAGAVTTLGQAARDSDRRGSGGLLGDAGDAAAIQGAQVGGRLVDRELQVRPSIRLQPGAPVRVMITRDLILEPYQS